LTISIGVPLIFLGVVGKVLIFYVEYINTLKKEKINNNEKYNELFMKSDLEHINSELLKDNNSSLFSNSSIPKSFLPIKYINERNLLIFVYTVDILCIIYSFIAQEKSKFYKINDEYGFCNHG